MFSRLGFSGDGIPLAACVQRKGIILYLIMIASGVLKSYDEFNFSDVARVWQLEYGSHHTNLHKILLDNFILRLCEQC